MKTTVRQAQAMQGALKALGDRFLPTLDADMKVGRLLEMVTEALQLHSRAINKIAQRAVEEAGGQQEIDKLSALGKQMFIGNVQEQQDEYASQEMELEIKETWYVKSEDLPKERSGDKGVDNATGRGSIIAGLGQLFERPKE